MQAAAVLDSPLRSGPREEWASMGKRMAAAKAARVEASFWDLRDFQWDPTLTGRRSSLPQKNRMRVRKFSKLRNPRALALIV